MPKFTQEINDMITQRQIYTAAEIDKKTYWSYDSYRMVAETGDLRYDYAHMLADKWPGGTIEQWIEKLPVEFAGRLLDYGRGQNKITTQFRDMSPEMLYEYDYFHTVNADHYPIPKSLGGLFEYNNCIVRPKVANLIRQNFDDETLLEALEVTRLSYFG